MSSPQETDWSCRGRRALIVLSFNEGKECLKRARRMERKAIMRESEIDDEMLRVNMSCVVCMARRREFVFVDCGHVCVCGVCLRGLRDRARSNDGESKDDICLCPMCRRKVLREPIRVYY